MLFSTILFHPAREIVDNQVGYYTYKQNKNLGLTTNITFAGLCIDWCRMKLADSNIIIVAEQTPRARYFRNLLEEEFDKDIRIAVESYDHVIESDITPDNTLFIIDLMDFERSAYDSIEKLKSNFTSSKIIALHIYQSNELIQPLFDNGVDGYISSDPTRKEFFTAVRNVLNGEKHYPSYSG